MCCENCFFVFAVAGAKLRQQPALVHISKHIEKKTTQKRDLTYRLFSLGAHSQIIGGMRAISPLSILKCSSPLVPDKSGKVLSFRADDITSSFRLGKLVNASLPMLRIGLLRNSSCDRLSVKFFRALLAMCSI